MASQLEVLSALRALSNYYGKEPGPQKVNFYLSCLADIDVDALRYAVLAWIKRSPFFPRVSELRQAASEYQPRIDYLAEEYQRLFDAFFLAGELDPAAWEDLAQSFERADRPARADHTRKKFKAMWRMVEEQGEEGVR